MPINTIAIDSLKSARPLDVVPPEPTGLLGGSLPSTSDTILLLIVVMLITDALMSPTISRCLRSYRTELIGMRKRNNAFDGTISTPVAGSIILAANLLLFGGIACFQAFNSIGEMPGPNTGVGMCATAIGALYMFHYIAYNIVGYAFTDAENTRRWISGYIAAQGFTALWLAAPAILLLFLPSQRTALLIICAIIFAIFKISFICKGFRIFYRDFSSCLYFILYLCSLEIIPVICLYSLLESGDEIYRIFNNI